MSNFKLETIQVRNNPWVNATEHKCNKYARDFFYQTPISLVGNSCIVDFAGNLHIRVLSSILPNHLLEQLETASEKHKQLMQLRSIADCRGNHTTLTFGSYIERGGSGKIWTRKNEVCPGFLEDIEEVGQFLSKIFIKLCPEIAVDSLNIPETLRLWHGITLMFWNITSISMEHIDTRDLKWSLIVPFGKRSKGLVDLPYLNSTAKVSRGGLYIINSTSIYHNVVDSNIWRESLVLTNHAAVFKRFTNIDTSNLFCRNLKY